jgi:hypothetical protein
MIGGGGDGGGVGPPPVLVAVGGGMGRATGGVFFEHAPTTTVSRRTGTSNALAFLLITALRTKPVELLEPIGTFGTAVY